jgi:putative nucleotidyltransferase with HDIG domain
MTKKKVLVQDLVPGMYVFELDRPWLDTPFLLQGFYIESKDQIDEIKKYCEFVYIDPLKDSTSHFTPITRQGASATGPDVRRLDAELKKAAPLTGTIIYENRATIEEELPAAKNIYQKSHTAMNHIIQDVRNDREINRESLDTTVNQMIDSIVRNPDAMMLLTKLKDKDSYTYGHAIDVAIYMLAFGRHLGYDQKRLQLLGMGGLLFDIGKLKLPSELLEKKTKLEPEEYELLKTHVEHSLEILSKTPNMPAEVIDIVATHHERQNGSGYPKGLKGADISTFGRMAAIVDCFDALTSDRPYASSVLPFDALQMIYKWKGQYYHAPLVQQFMQCIGIYPVGGLVELSNGEVAIVLSQNKVNRLKPKVMVILDTNKHPYKNPLTLDLSESNATKDPHEIKRVLENGMYGVDPREYFI